MTSRDVTRQLRDWTFDTATRDRVDAIFAPWASATTPGMAVGIYREGEIVHAQGYGMANLEHDIPITPASIFHVASISKQFTCLCIALLASEGALDIDDDIRLYVPETPDFGPTITIRHLIHHVSGLRDQWMLLTLAGWRSEDLVTERDVLDLLQRQAALNFQPNEEYLYCNTGYTLLSLVVKRVSGLSLRTYAQERIFGPLGMTSTHFHDDHSEIVKGRTQAYEPRDGGGYRISIPEFDVVGTTSLFTTVDDLARWDANFAHARIGGPAMIEQLQTPGTFNDGTAMTYAWGLMQESFRGTARSGHSGADHGYRAEYLRLPEFGFAVAILSNVADSNPRKLAERVAGAVLGDHLDPPGVPGGPRDRPAGVPALVTPAAIAGTWHCAGRNTYLTISTRDGKARIDLPEPVELEAPGNGRFTLPDRNLTIVVAGTAARPEALDVTFQGKTTRYTRLASHVPDLSGLQACAGTYWSDELAVSMDVHQGGPGGAVVLRRRKFDDQTFEPLEPGVFGRGSLEIGSVITFQRDGRKRVTGFLLTSGRIRNLAFRRQS